MAETEQITDTPAVVLNAFTVNDAAPTVFPERLRSEKLPYATFTAYHTGTASSPCICLPVPLGLSVGDGMTYSTINLGIIGSIMSETMTQMSQQNSVSGVIGAGIGAMTGSIINKASKMNAAAAASILSRKMGFETVADTLDFNQRQVLAPNTNTTFQSSNIRSYSFSFKLVSRSQKEAASIKSIVNTFRANMYPEGNDVILSYPPVWEIRFYNEDSRENAYLPKIYQTYLTSMTATFNASTNIFHRDGAPVETDVALSFQETKALTKNDIKTLASGRR